MYITLCPYYTLNIHAHNLVLQFCTFSVTLIVYINLSWHLQSKFSLWLTEHGLYYSPKRDANCQQSCYISQWLPSCINIKALVENKSLCFTFQIYIFPSLALVWKHAPYWVPYDGLFVCLFLDRDKQVSLSYPTVFLWLWARTISWQIKSHLMSVFYSV